MVITSFDCTPAANQLIGLSENEIDSPNSSYESSKDIFNMLIKMCPYFDIQNSTAYNTVHNRRIPTLGIMDDVEREKNENSKREWRNVTFNDENVDPNVRRFRTLISSNQQ